MITALVFLNFNWVIFGKDPDADVFLSSFFLLPSAVDPVPIILWTLKQELLFYAIFGLAIIWPTAGMVVVLAWAVSSPFIPSGDSVLLSWLFHPQNIEFGFGIVSAYLFVKHKISAPKALLVACIGFIAFGVCGAVARGSGMPVVLEVTLLGLFGLFTIYGIACAGLKLPRAVIFVGTASYSIYLIHTFFISAFNKVIFKFAPALPGALSLAILAISAALCGCVYYLMFERPIENWRKNRVITKPAQP